MQKFYFVNSFTLLIIRNSKHTWTTKNIIEKYKIKYERRKINLSPQVPVSNFQAFLNARVSSPEEQNDEIIQKPIIKITIVSESLYTRYDVTLAYYQRSTFSKRSIKYQRKTLHLTHSEMRIFSVCSVFPLLSLFIFLQQLPRCRWI